MKESIYRASRTFFQTAFGYLAVNLALVDFTSEKQTLKTILIGLLISSVSAGASAVMNVKKEDENEV